MKKVIILSGTSGSGKTHYATELMSEYPNSFKVSADHYFMTEAGYKFDPEKLTEAHAFCFRNFINFLRSRTEMIIVDNINTKVWEMAPYVLGAHSFGYEPEIVFIRHPLEEAIERNQHGVPAKVIHRQFENLSEIVLPNNWRSSIVGSY